jgi:hypothetical protein
MDRCAFNGEGRMLGVLIVPLVPLDRGAAATAA